MERDFLCAIGGKEKGTTAGAAEEARTRSGCPGGGGGGAPAMQWQFPGKPGAAPAFMSFGASTEEEEEGAKEFSISGFRPPAAGDACFDGIGKHASTPATSHQQHGPRAQGSDHGAPTHHHLLGGSRMVRPSSSSSHHTMPFNQQANSMLRTQSLHHNANASGGVFKNQPFAMSNGFGGATVGAYGARNPRSQNSAQLTVFYNGTVNVFDNVSVEKAQELMLLASKACVSSMPSVMRKPDSPISAPAKISVPEVMPARPIVTQKPEHSVCHLASTSTPMSIVPVSVALPRNTSNCTAGSTEQKTAVQPPVVVVPTSQVSSSQLRRLGTTSAASVMPRAVPQARKASLARFLERRKERVTTVEPYPTSKSPLESNGTKGAASALSESSFNVAPASNNDKEPLRFGQRRNISFSSEACPSTKLHI